MRDELDGILCRTDEVIPSSGFAASVMEAVKREADAPPPIPFPWKRAWPGLAVAGFALICLLVAAVDALSRLSISALYAESSTWASTFETAKLTDAGWISAALVLSFVSLRISMYLAERTSQVVSSTGSDSPTSAR